MRRRRMWEDDRVPWEYADGPQPGVDVPIAGEPREEEAPAVPVEPSDEHDGDGSEDAARQRAKLEEREVTVRDPDLSPEANDRLTEEVREVVGEERVTVPSRRPRPSHGERPPRHGLLAYLSRHRLLLVITFAMAVVIGAIVGFTTGSWWILPLAGGLHAIGTTTVAAIAVRTTTITERPDPTVVAMLEEEGIPNPEEHFTNLVAEFAEEPRTEEEPRAGAADVITPGANERTAEAAAEPSKAAAEQSSAMTPTAGRSRPAGKSAMPEGFNWAIVVGLVVVSVFIPAAAGGGWLWLMTAVMVPLGIGWIALQRVMASTEKRPSGRTLIITLILGTGLAVAVFCAVVALAFQH
jgi:hypothetical protein